LLISPYNNGLSQPFAAFLFAIDSSRIRARLNTPALHYSTKLGNSDLRS